MATNPPQNNGTATHFGNAFVANVACRRNELRFECIAVRQCAENVVRRATVAIVPKGDVVDDRLSPSVVELKAFATSAYVGDGH